LFALVPAALPVFDLAPWSGRRFLDEFDVLLALCIAVAWARLPVQGVARSAGALGWALRASWLVFAVAVVRALWPWPGFDINALDEPMGVFNALRLVKGAVWAALLWMLARRLQHRGVAVAGCFGWGMCAGLTGTVLWILAERMAFSYLLDFGSDYRISGPFSDMSLGGAYVECYVACALPFLLIRLLPPAPLIQTLAGLPLMAGAVYALMVTYSRGGQAAGVLAVLMLLACQLISGRQRLKRLAVATFAVLLGAVVAWPVLTGGFAQQRMATLNADAGVRERHWTESLRLVPDELAPRMLGMGAGRYAALWMWQSAADRLTASHRLVDLGDGQHALRLSSGYAYFVDQVVTVAPTADVQLRLRWRSASLVRDRNPPRTSAPNVGLCQKWIIASFDCAQPQPQQPQQAQPTAEGGWQVLTMRLRVPDAGPGRLPRPLRLSLNNGGRVPLDVTDVSLTDSQGVELLQNGRFDAGMDRWTFTSDDHLAWHAKSLLIGLCVEFGWLGALILLSLPLLGAGAALRLVLRGEPEGGAQLAALSAFMAIGLIDTLIDVPRFLLLFQLLCLMPAFARTGHAAEAAAARASARPHPVAVYPNS
jgi:hypothetical protein